MSRVDAFSQATQLVKRAAVALEQSEQSAGTRWTPGRTMEVAKEARVLWHAERNWTGFGAEQVRRGVQELVTTMEEASRANARHHAQAHRAIDELGGVLQLRGDADAALERGRGAAWIDEQLTPSASDWTTDIMAAAARDPRVGELPTWAGPLVDRRKDPRSIATLTRMLEADPRVTRASLLTTLDEILARSDDEIRYPELSAIAVTHELRGDKHVRLPKPSMIKAWRDIAVHDGWRDPGATIRPPRHAVALAELRAWRTSQVLKVDPSVTPTSVAAELRSILSKPEVEVTVQDVRRIAAIELLGRAQRPPLPATYAGKRWSHVAALAASEGTTSTEVMRELAKLRVHADLLGATARERRATLRTEVQGILRKPLEEVTATDISRIAAAREHGACPELSIPEAFDSYAKRGLGMDYLPAHNEVVSLRIAAAARDLATDASVTRGDLERELLALVRIPKPQLTAEQLRRMAVLQSVAGSKALDAPWLQHVRAFARSLPARPAVEDPALSAHVNALRLWARARRMDGDPGITRATLQNEVRQILAKPDDQITRVDLSRLALAELVGPDKRVSMPLPLRHSRIHTFAGGRPPSRQPANGGRSSDKLVSAELRNLRAGLLIDRMNADPAVTRETVRTDIRSILLKPVNAVTRDDFQRIAYADQLAPAKRVELPPPADERYPRPWVSSYDAWAPDSHAVRAELNSLRLWDEIERLNADPAVTKAEVMRRVHEILLRTDGAPTDDELRFLVAAQKLAPEKRAPFPPPGTTVSLEEYYHRDELSSGFLDQISFELDRLRSFVRRTTPDGWDDLMRAIEVGDGRVGELAANINWAVQAERPVGASRSLDQDQLLSRVSAMLDSQEAAREPLRMRRVLEATEQVLRKELDGPGDRFAQRALELVDLNLRRTRGEVEGGYGEYPEFGEIARIRTMIRFIEATKREAAASEVSWT